MIANVTAEPVRDPATIRELLVRQVTARVRWRESMATMARLGVGERDRVRRRQGADRPGQARRARGAALLNVQEPADVEALAAQLAGSAA